MHFGMHCPHAESAMQFLQGIGLAVAVKAGSKGFIDHVEVVDGGLYVDPNAAASGILHEAGHLAIVPKQFRHHLSGDLSKGIAKIFAELDMMDLEPDAHLQRAMLQASDPEATAWAFAAGKAIGIPETMIIQSAEYDGEGDFIRSALSALRYIGINGLSHAGFCVLRENAYRPLPVYPSLSYWLQH
ncbi:hypothetical protein ALQ64_03151 [Pseudomonas cannabina]|uniref:Uncharacterized protein n=2 Tax=Pseudomonas cannabina TaxID=86840 RepID=A0A3M3K2N8_PSECA|nr:hypothetical protein ALQ64_03151 [Pseudomonas cannabina]